MSPATRKRNVRTEAAVAPGTAPGARLMIRMAFGQHDALGPGKARLLELVDRHGSISAAARAMGISYRRAWLLIEGVRRTFREKVLAARHGGARGGGAGLTPFGRGLVERYRAIERAARAAVEADLRAMERDVAPRLAPGRRHPRPSED
ncbi:MAG: winged helix-turn-helix domain-containing protein [Rhodospirillales bacterium]